MPGLISALGIDLSTGATGLVVLGDSGGKVPTTLLAREIKFPKLDGLERKAAIVAEVMKAIHEFKPDRIVIEGYSLNLQNASSVIPLVEIGAIQRFMLKMDGFAWMAPNAGQLKKFVTGKGNAPKDVVIMHVFKRWAFTATTNNIADAYGCAAMGLAQLGALPGVTKDMQSAVDELELLRN